MRLRSRGPLHSLSTVKRGEFHKALDWVLGMKMSHQYETAISHQLYNNGDWIILGTHETEEEAIAFHSEAHSGFMYFCPVQIKDVHLGVVFERQD